LVKIFTRPHLVAIAVLFIANAVSEWKLKTFTNIQSRRVRETSEFCGRIVETALGFYHCS